MSTVIVAPEVRDLDVLTRNLEDWIPRWMPAAKDIQVRDLSYPRGAGQSHETILFDLTWSQDGKRHAQGCAVRIKPTRHTVFPDDLYEQQHRLMRLLHEDGRVRVAKIFYVEAAPSFLSAPFFVMEKLRGRVAVSIPPYVESGWVRDATPAQRARMWEGGVRQLATIQKTPLAGLDFLQGPAQAPSGLLQEWDKYTRFAQWVSQDRRWRPLELAIEKLKKFPKHQPAGLVWGDARIGNMMFDENFDVIAVMDWEQPSLGGALHDLAWWLVLGQTMHGGPDGRPRLDGIMTRDEIIALWREVTDIPIDDLEWYEAFTRLKIGCLGIRTATLRGYPLPNEDELARRLQL